MKITEFFEQNATNPTAWSVGCGWYVRFSMARDLFVRDEVEVKKLVSKYKLKISREGNLMVFSGVKSEGV